MVVALLMRDAVLRFGLYSSPCFGLEAAVLINFLQKENSMHCKTLMVSVLCAAIGSLAYAQSAPKIKEVQAEYTSPTSGSEMFGAYCSVCHGVDGTGNGPAAPALKKQPANLTQLKAKNGGKFPVLRVLGFIKGETAVSAHGTRDMPMWGTIFSRMGSDATVTVRLNSLISYIESLQK
jgi:mono/diheme cytochrome c family protein